MMIFWQLGRPIVVDVNMTYVGGKKSWRTLKASLLIRVLSSIPLSALFESNRQA